MGAVTFFHQTRTTGNGRRGKREKARDPRNTNAVFGTPKSDLDSSNAVFVSTNCVFVIKDTLADAGRPFLSRLSRPESKKVVGKSLSFRSK